MATTSRIFDLTNGLERARIYVSAHMVAVIQCPSTARLRIGVEHDDAITSQRGTVIRRAKGFESVELSAAAVPNGVLELAFGDVGDDFTVVTGAEGAFTAAQGAAGVEPWNVSGTVTDPTTAAKLEAVKAAVQVGAFGAGQPFVAQYAALAPGDTHVFDVAAALARNGRAGVIRSHPENAGVISLQFSSDGATYTTAVPLLWPGESYTLDGLDLAALRVTFDDADDVAIMEAH